MSIKNQYAGKLRFGIYVFICIFLVLYAFFLVYGFIADEDPVYIWDYAGAYNRWRDFFSSNLGQFIWKMRYSDYNLTPFLILQPAKLLPFGSRFDYIFSLYLFYFIPFCFLYAYFAKKISKGGNAVFLLNLFLVYSFIPYWHTMLRGYVDISAILFMTMALIVLAYTNFNKKKNIGKAIIFGCLLYFPFLFRRYYAYSIISMYILTPIFLGIAHMPSLVKIKRIVVFFIVAILTTTGMLVLCQYPLMVKILSTNYSVIYSAYSAPIKDIFVFLINNTGIFYISLFIISCVMIICCKYKIKLLCSYCLSNMFLTFFLFIKTQSPGIHHLIPIYFWMIIVCSCGIYILLKSTPYIKIYTTFFSILFLLFPVFSLSDIKNEFAGYPVIPSVEPLKLDNFKNYKKLTEYLLELGKANKIFVLGSSDKFSDALIYAIGQRKFNSNFIWSSQVDLRDGFNLDFLDAKYIALAIPVQLHLKPGSQMVVEIPAQSLLNCEDIGMAYKKTGCEYNLADGIKAFIFEKVRDPTTREKESFKDKFYKVYPQWRNAHSQADEQRE